MVPEPTRSVFGMLNEFRRKTAILVTKVNQQHPVEWIDIGLQLLEASLLAATMHDHDCAIDFGHGVPTRVVWTAPVEIHDVVDESRAIVVAAPVVLCMPDHWDIDAQFMVTTFLEDGSAPACCRWNSSHSSIGSHANEVFSFTGGW